MIAYGTWCKYLDSMPACPRAECVLRSSYSPQYPLSLGTPERLKHIRKGDRSHYVGVARNYSAD